MSPLQKPPSEGHPLGCLAELPNVAEDLTAVWALLWTGCLWIAHDWIECLAPCLACHRCLKRCVHWISKTQLLVEWRSPGEMRACYIGFHAYVGSSALEGCHVLREVGQQTDRHGAATSWGGAWWSSLQGGKKKTKIHSRWSSSKEHGWRYAVKQCSESWQDGCAASEHLPCRRWGFRFSWIWSNNTSLGINLKVRVVLLFLPLSHDTW